MTHRSTNARRPVRFSNRVAWNIFGQVLGDREAAAETLDGADVWTMADVGTMAAEDSAIPVMTAASTTEASMLLWLKLCH